MLAGKHKVRLPSWVIERVRDELFRVLDSNILTREERRSLKLIQALLASAKKVRKDQVLIGKIRTDHALKELLRLVARWVD